MRDDGPRLARVSAGHDLAADLAGVTAAVRDWLPCILAEPE